MQSVTEEETTTIDGESDESESRTYRIERINRITNRNEYLTAKVKVNGIEKEFKVNTRSSISIMPADETIPKKTKIQNVKLRYQDVNKNELKLRGQIPTDIEYEINKQKMQRLITERDDITPLLGMDFTKKPYLAIRNPQTDENNQSEKKRGIENAPDLFKNETTIKDTENNTQLKPGHYQVKQKARPIPLHLKEESAKH